MVLYVTYAGWGEKGRVVGFTLGVLTVHDVLLWVDHSLSFLACSLFDICGLRLFGFVGCALCRGVVLWFVKARYCARPTVLAI